MRGAVLLVLVAAFAGAHADDAFSVQVPAALDADAPIAEAVLAECNIESMVGNYVYSGVKRRYPAAQIRRAGDATEVRLTILAARGVGPGPYTEKSIDLRADLVRGGKLIDSNVFRRAVGGSGFGRFRGACDVFARIATTLGRDVASWLGPALARVPSAAPAAPNDVKLEQLQKLREEGLISRAEYEQKRAELLKAP